MELPLKPEIDPSLCVTKTLVFYVVFCLLLFVCLPLMSILDL